MNKNILFSTLKSEWLRDPDFREEYNVLELEFQIALELIKARIEAGLTQEELANKMATTQSAIARLESGKSLPSVKVLNKYAKATGHHLHLSII